MLSTRHLSYRYQDEDEYALKDINVDITRGQVVGILGANGSGKSTLFMNLLGVFKPEQGTVLLDDHPLQYDKTSLRQLRQRVSMVFQDPEQQIFYSDINSELAFTLRNLGYAEDEINKRIEQVLDLVDAQSFRHKPIQYLSYGQKKRIAIAGALMLESEYLLLDEPTAGLDPSGREHMITTIGKITQQGTRVMISSHDIDLIYQISDYLYVLKQGAILMDGETEYVCLQTELMEQAGLTQPWLVKLHLRLGIPLYKNEQQLFNAGFSFEPALPTDTTE